MTTLVLIRGLPGSGKSTLAREYAARGYRHYEADQYFTGRDEVYRFDPKRLKAAHSRCLGRAKSSLQAGANVVVANTFTTMSEMKPYIETALRYHCNIEIIAMTGDYGSVHNVPAASIERMRARWESLEDVE